MLLKGSANIRSAVGAASANPAEMLYYLNLVFDGVLLPDPEGVDLPDVQSACDRASKIAREIIGEEAKGGRLPLSWSIVITDDSDEIVAEVPFSDALTIH